jgi:hypothetical protein
MLVSMLNRSPRICAHFWTVQFLAQADARLNIINVKCLLATWHREEGAVDGIDGAMQITGSH